MQNKSEMINRIAELAEENAKLKKEYDILDGIIDLNNAKIGQLQKENKQLKELFEIESLTDIKTGETMYRSRQIMYFVDILQEIKEIAKSGFAVCDDDCGNANRFTDILDIINKAEEE